MIKLNLIILLTFSLFAEPWEDITWINLLHYKKTLTGYNSLIDSKEFFLSEDGKTNPKNEYLKFKESINNQTVRCKFIARTKFIIPDFNPLVECIEYNEWFNLINPKGLTLIFPSVYLNNPASAFGHTLLRIDSDDPEIVRYSVNFSAQTNGESAFLYAFKGVFGGYNGQFAVAPYYNLVKKYNDFETRDIWEYKLNFSQEETIKLLEHLWELQNININYYYFDENCSYHLLGLFDYVKPELKLSDKFNIWVMPLDTVKEFSDLIVSSNLRTGINEIINLKEKNNKDLRLIKNYINNKNLDEIKDPESLNLLQDYLGYLTTKGKISEQESAKLSYPLYKKISNIPAQKQYKVIKEDPREHHKFNRVSLDLVNTEIEYKPAYHSLNDLQYGASQYSQLDLLKINIDEKLKIKKFDLIDIYSLSPRGELIKPISYKLNLNYEDILNRKKNIDFGFGYSWNYNKFLIYSLLESNPSWMFDDFYFGVGNETGVIQDDCYGRTILKGRGIYYFDNEIFSSSILRTIPITTNFQGILEYQNIKEFQDNRQIYSFKLHYYF